MLRKLSLFFCLILLFVSAPSQAQDGPFLPGEIMPQMQLPAPTNPAHLDYLGLTPEISSFALSDLGGKDLILQVFSMYCPICQKEAPYVNELYELLQSGNLGDRVKLLGVGAGNSELEVSVFRDRYSVLFPMIPDPDYVLHKIFGAVGTPYFLVLAPTGNGDYVVRLSHLGPFGTPGDFFKRIRESLETK